MPRAATEATVAPATPPRRIWSVPTLRELPKLTDLTLASAIGGGGGTGGGGSTVFGILLAAGLGGLLLACSAHDATGPGDGVVPRPVGTREVTCQVEIGAGSLTCAGPRLAPGQQVIGGQGVDVQLISSNVSAAAGVFHADVRVGNLSDVDLGSTGDGDTTGIFVFFVSGPTVTAGTGTVTLANHDTTATFTATGQKAFWYDTLLGGHRLSDPKGWEWNYDAGVVSFSFTVLVAADVGEQGVPLHWVEVPDLSVVGSNGSFTAAAASSPTEALILTDANYVLRRTGAGWRKEKLPSGAVGYPGAVSAAGPDRYYLGVGLNLYLLDHGMWLLIRTWPAGYDINQVSALGDTIVVATYGSSAILSRFDGTSWHDTAKNDHFAGVDAAGAAVASNGQFYHWSGTAWDEWPTEVLPTVLLNRVWFDPSSFSGGYFYFHAASVAVPDGDYHFSFLNFSDALTQGLMNRVAYYDSVWTWQPVGLQYTETDQVVYVNAGLETLGWSVFGNGVVDQVNEALSMMTDDSAGGFYLTREDGTLGQYTPGGSVTSIVVPATIPASRAIRGVAANGASAVAFTRVPIGNTGGGDVLVWDGSTWELETITTNHLTSAWVAAPNDMIVGGTDGLYTYDGATWDLLDTTTIVGQDVKVVWGSGSTLFAWRSTELMRRQGGVWSSVASGLSIVPNRMGGSSPTDLYLGSTGYELLRFNGSTLTSVTLPTTPSPASTQITAIASTGPNDLWIAAAGPGGASEVRLAYWDGSTWTTWLGGAVAIERAGGIVILGPGKALIGDKAGIFAVDAGAGTVRRAVSADAGVTGERNFVAGDTGEYWAVGQSGEFFQGTP